MNWQKFRIVTRVFPYFFNSNFKFGFHIFSLKACEITCYSIQHRTNLNWNIFAIPLTDQYSTIIMFWIKCLLILNTIIIDYWIIQQIIIIISQWRCQCDFGNYTIQLRILILPDDQRNTQFTEGNHHSKFFGNAANRDDAQVIIFPSIDS